MRTVVITSALLVSALALAGCTAAPADEGVSVVASTNVYGDLASTIGGDLISVTSLIDSPDQDPHSYTASAQDRLAVSRADLVIVNGGGYDPFMEALLSGASAPTLDAVELTGTTGNEHVWYDLSAMDAVADAIAAQLGTIDPANAATYTANADDLTAQLDALRDRIPDEAGLLAATTEPVPLYLIEAFGMADASPPAFTEAIEEGDDVPPAALNELLELLDSGTIAFLAYNSQTASAETERVRAAAEAAGVPVVDFTELLPPGDSYVSWMTANVDAIEAALQ